MMAQDRGHVTPRLRRGRGQGAPGRWHPAGFPQGAPALPRLVGDGLLDLFLVVATVREDDDRPRILGTASVLQVQRLDGLHHEGRRSARRQRLLPALALALERDGTPRHPPVREAQPESGPRMPHDTSLAMLERLGVCWRPTGALWKRTLHDHRPMPGQPVHLVPGLGTGRGWLLGAARARRAGAMAMGLQPLRAWGCVPSGQPGGFCEGMLRGHDQQKQQITGADPLQTSTDPATPREPSLEGASPQGASALEPRDE
jgi:hypothetical protein